MVEARPDVCRFNPLANELELTKYIDHMCIYLSIHAITWLDQSPSCSWRPRSDYEMEQSGGFRVPDGYIRYPRRAAGEDDVATCEYCLEVIIVNW